MPELSAEERIQRAKASAAPWIYINGFQTALSNSDVVVFGERTGEPVVVLNLSFTMAKTLALALTNVINTVEEKAGREIMTTYDMDRFLSE